MTCFHPLTAYRSESGDIIFNGSRGYREKLQLPCGQCIGCRLERSRQWAIRCMHEAKMHKENCFITLTYDDMHLPADRSLSVRAFQLFMKRLRKRFGSGIRFYHCGEYGEKLGRPHYHACLFGFDFPDKKLFTIRNDNKLYTSQALMELWPYGFSSIGDVTFESAAYVARYIMKKITGSNAEKHYERFCDVTGVVYNLKPEYTTMSRRPGIGATWFDKYHSDVYPYDRVIINGKKMRPPKYYDNRFEVLDRQLLEDIKFFRQENAKNWLDNNTKERLNVRERVQELALKQLPRHLT